MPAQNVAVKAVVTPVSIGGASLAGRRFGHHVGGWLVALPMTSGPVAFFLGAAAFAAATIVLSFLDWPAWQTFPLVLGSLLLGYVATSTQGGGR